MRLPFCCPFLRDSKRQEVMYMRPYYLIFFLMLGAVIYFLYSRGLAVTKCIAAVLFVFRAGRDADRVKIDSCNGWFRH